MSTMNDALNRWLAEQLPDAADLQLTPLRAEASFRSFFRVCSPPAAASWILMSSPPDKEHNQQFEVLARVFARGQIPVPEILAADRTRGWYLLTDLGRQDLEAAYDGEARDEALGAAIETLVRLQQVIDPAIQAYTPSRFADELMIFSEWFATEALGHPPPTQVRSVFDALVDRTVSQIQCCVHRDYHCRNLLYDRGRFGVVDFQDALMGPASYDLASLLHDCYSSFTPPEVQRWQDYYLSRTLLDLNPTSFGADLDYSATQRMLKAVGIFARLKLRDGKDTHLTYIGPVLGRIRQIAGRHDQLAPLAGWLGRLDLAPAIEALQGAKTR